jgi:hypothetical protein
MEGGCTSNNKNKLNIYHCINITVVYSIPDMHLNFQTVTGSIENVCQFLYRCVFIVFLFFNPFRFTNFKFVIWWIKIIWLFRVCVCHFERHLPHHADASVLYSKNESNKWMSEYGALLEWHWQGKSEVLGEKPVPTHFIYHSLARGWQLTSWDMAWPALSFCISEIIIQHKNVIHQFSKY